MTYEVYALGILEKIHGVVMYLKLWVILWQKYNDLL